MNTEAVASAAEVLAVIKICQTAVHAFMIYIFWFREAYGHMPLLLYGTVMIATIFALLDLTGHRARLPMNKMVGMLFLYGGYAFAAGLLISRNRDFFLSMMGTYFAFAIVCWECFYISYRLHETQWILNTIMISCIVCAIQTIWRGYGYQTEVIVTTMGPENNPHVLGYTMLLGIFSLLADEKQLKKHFVLRFMLILVFVYVILLSGSRKSLLCAGVFLVYWFFSALKTEKRFTAKKLMILSVLLAASLGGGYYVLNRYVNTDTYKRLLMLFEQDGAISTRWLLYVDAFAFWKKSPIFGIGFGQYQIWSAYGTYSHSSYAEILSCTGILGMLIFFIPVAKLAWELLKRTRAAKQRYDYVMCFIMMVIELLMGIGQIYIYAFSHLLCITYLAMRKEELDKKPLNGR